MNLNFSTDIDILGSSFNALNAVRLSYNIYSFLF